MTEVIYVAVYQDWLGREKVARMDGRAVWCFSSLRKGYDKLTELRANGVRIHRSTRIMPFVLDQEK